MPSPSWQHDEERELLRRRITRWVDRARAFSKLFDLGVSILLLLGLAAFFLFARLQACAHAATEDICKRAVAELQGNEEAAAWLGMPIELVAVTGSPDDGDESDCVGWVEGPLDKARLEVKEWASEDGGLSRVVRLTSDDGARDLAFGPLRDASPR